MIGLSHKENMRFYSSRGEDKWIANNVKLPEKGFYVDIGAAHPTRMSNTAFLRDRGWEGIQIDADPFWKRYWDKLNLELITSPVWMERGKVSFCANEKAHRLSCIDRFSIGEKREAVVLNDLFSERKIKHIDFMSLDVEGIEYDLFLSLDKYYWPDVLVFEYNTLGKTDFRLQKYLQDFSCYKEALRTNSNFVFCGKYLCWETSA
jgi:hypothetical protein